ncbi:RNA polymerase sigma factor [Deminuibacter soli]|uniref:Sigma-70 family RNA polymerase sigma factor n=1 Tax=Deminuibacter soli TaxID=2291815 RepID=A0A3E1NF01_9BACT|nr:sigma-70 family RNA polymerase sigma factor [Deminuibacter soli]RFM26539.1 sigma-70 family RNA polymerase sigma factor [Deminuibacter soli]
MTDNSRLIAACLAGDVAAQEQLYKTFAGQMMAICYRYTKSVTDAQDVLQEGFINVFRCLHQYKGGGELGAWIRRIMVNAALNYLKQTKRYQGDMVLTDDYMHPVSGDDPVINLSAKELADLIRQLPSGYQTIFNLHAVEGYSHVEIAGMMGISESTSRSQYMRARTLLATWITKYDADATKKMNYAG